jgi:ubiquinone/menaquinone biosynthesis C-methylase UbiE
MGFYARVVFPRICDWVMRDARMACLRSELLSSVEEDVLEIGFGTGLNLEHYPVRVRRIAAIDPAQEMGRIASERIKRSSIEVDRKLLGAEDLPFNDDSFDCVVSTWTLCSIPNVTRALDEVYRVLKPGGRFLFLEHGKSDDPSIQRWQRRLNPIQRRLAVGCRLDLDVEAAIRSQPFRLVSIERFVMERTPRTHGTMYRGAASK